MLPVFPSAYIDDSLLTAVFVGVLLLWWLTERFGWPTTGLVVPGYLGAILAIRPDAALVVAVEAVLTYAIADAVGRRIQRVLPLDVSFGRDRFFLIILASIFVRLGTEVWPGPELLQAIGFDRADGWHSIGLVLVPLTANALWKPGLRAGVPLVALPVLLVFLLLRYILLPFTNLSLVTLELTYQDLEWSFLGSPRVYLLLVVGSFIASHATVRFGWDFGGIIVCGLLAIAWLEPFTVLATLIEVLLVVFIVRALVAVPPLKTANLSGLRPIVLAFAVSYAVKFMVAFVGQGVFPSFTTADLFGFGYLLPALLATRVWRHGQIARVLVPTVIVSLLGFVAGTALGGLLSIISPDVGEATLDPTGERPGPGWMVAAEAVGDPSTIVRSDVRDELSIALALAESGRVYTGRFVRVDRFADGLILDGVGTGAPAVYWPAKGAPGLEVWAPDAWQPGMAEAALAVADRVGAGLVVLGPGATVSAAHRRGALRIDVRAGQESAFVGPAAVAARLADLVTDPVEGDQAVLTLSADGVAQAAVERMIGANVPQRVQYEPFTALTAYERGVALPALRSRGDVRWQAIADTWASRFGGRVVRDGQDVLVDGPDEGPFAVDLRVRGGDGGVMVEVRSPIDDMVRVGEAWANDVDAHALMVVADDAATDLARVWWRAAAIHHPGVDGISIHRLRYDDTVGGDAVVYDGRSVSPVHEPYPIAERAVDTIERAGFTAVYGDSSFTRARFYDGGDRRRESVQPFGGHIATVWVGQRLRAAYAELDAQAPFAQALTAAGVVLTEGSVQERLRGEPIPTIAFDDAWAALARYAITEHPGALERMVSELGPGATVRVVPDVDVGRSFLVIERGGLIGVAPLGYSGRPVVWQGVTLPAVWRAR